MATHGNRTSNPSSNPRNIVRLPPKKHGASGDNCQTVKRKRRNETIDRRNETDDLAPSGGPTSVVLEQKPCVFCHSCKQTEGTGPFVAYDQGKEVTVNVDNVDKVTHIHLNCLSWTPKVYFKDGIIQNLNSEIVRANRLKCSSCGEKGAGLGCCKKLCQKTYHVPCAYDIPECRWEDDGYSLLCPKHASCKFPSELEAKSGKQDTEKGVFKDLDVGKNLGFCGSGLSSDEKVTLVRFATSIGATVFKHCTNNVTHVIAATDSTGACIRTQKILMAILNGKWILSMEWIKACVESGHLVKEETYEVVLDNHGSSGGPKIGRLRVQKNDPKLFDKLNFYFIGEFVQAYKVDLVNLVKTAGGTITETRDQLLLSSHDEDTKPKGNQVTLIVYNADFSINSGFEDEISVKSRVLDAAQVLAQEVGCRVVPHIWILESIACGLIDLCAI